MAEKVTADQLIALSYYYHKEHRVMHRDVERAERLRLLIEESRDLKKPVCGDTIIAVGPKKTYGRGFLQNSDPAGYSAICVRPSHPFVWAGDEGEPPVFEASGGYWFGLDAEEGDTIEYAGLSDRKFKAWGHCGPCADGAFTFIATVNAWRVTSDQIY